MKVQLGTEARNAAANAVGALLDGGALVLYGDSGPVATLPFGSPAFAPADNGMIAATPIKAGVGSMRGVVQRWQATSADGFPVMSGTADSLGGPIEVFQGGTVRLSEFIYEVPGGVA